MQKFKNFLSNYALSILTGILIGTSFIPFPPWATLFCFVPLWIQWFSFRHEPDALRKIIISGWVAQFTLTLIGFNWVAFVAHEFGYLPWPVAILTLLLFCGFANLDIPIAGAIWHLLGRRLRMRESTSLLLLATVMALAETYVPTIFPWNYGYTWLWVEAPIAQTAEVFGFQGLSSIFILLNAASFWFWQKWQDYKNARTKINKFRLYKIATFTVAVFWVLNLYGYYLKSKIAEPDREVTVGVVQANIGNLQKAYAEKGYGFRDFITQQYLKLSTQAVDVNKNIDFLVWPETAYPHDMKQSAWSTDATPHYPPTAVMLTEYVKNLGTNLLTGGYGYAPSDGKLTNTFFVVEKSGTIQPHPYYKTILLAFGEYIPFSDYLPDSIFKLIPAGDFSRGLGPKIIELQTPQIKIGPQICYESLFPDFSLKLSRLGAEMIVNLTNDSWYGTWQEPYQHGYMTLARAIENRIPLVRATNTGISTVVLATGEVLTKSPLAKEWFHIYKIPYKSQPQTTIYGKYPRLVQLGLMILFMFVLIRTHFERNT